MTERLPWSKFSWDSWENEATLALVSMAAQGFWMRLLCIAVKEGGYVLIGGENPSLEKLARIVRASPAEVEGWLDELSAENVFSRTTKGVIYSRRIVRDVKNAKVNKENGKRGGNPSLRKDKGNTDRDNPPRNPPVKADKKRREKKREDIDPQPPGGGASKGSFARAMAAYPEAGRASTAPAKAEPEWVEVCGVEGEGRMLAAITAFAASDYAKADGGRRVPSLQRWLRDGKYLAWLPPESAPSTAWSGPPEVRAACVVAMGEERTKGYLDRCAWQDLPERAVTSTNGYLVTVLEREAGDALADIGVKILLEKDQAA